MDTNHFLAQDLAGNRYRVNRVRGAAAASTHRAASGAARDDRPVYQLDDGSALRRVDRDTFQVIGTGAYVSVVRE